MQAQVSSCLASCSQDLLTSLAGWAWTSLKDLSEPMSKSLIQPVLLWAGMVNIVQLYSKVTFSSVLVRCHFPADDATESYLLFTWA